MFGDGDASNGVEDGRSAAPLGGEDYRAWAAAGGTVHCDGRQRGSAVIVRWPAQPEAAVVVTAAHVLVDLERKQPYSRCEFHHLGLAQVPGSVHALLPARRLGGAFSADEDPAAATFGAQDWAFIAVDDPAGRLGRLRPRPWQEVASGVVEYFLLAWDDGAGRMVVSAPCQVRQSQADDLGGGAWPGQLLDDCDSGPGASGGGLLARTPGGVYLVGIRTGAHWSPADYPPEAFPAGPPDGAPWSVAANTNFARALDGELLGLLGTLVSEESSSVNVEQGP